MKPPFNYSRVAVAIGSALPLIFREPLKPNPEAIKMMDAQQPMNEEEAAQPVPEIEATGGNGEPFNDDATGEITPEDHQFIKAAIVITIGKRLIEARELCGWSQTKAAQMLGIPLKVLIRHERPNDRLIVSLTLMQRAAKLYEVSLDFLFGESDDWDTGARMTQERAVSRWLFREFDEGRIDQMEELRRIHDRIEAIGKIIAGISEHSETVISTFNRFRELNPAFEDARGGANVAGSIERLSASSNAARLTLKRFHMQLAGMAVEPESEVMEVSHAE